MADNHRFSGPVTVFHKRPMPERATPAGYAALIAAYDLAVPLPRRLFATGEHHRIREEGGWRILTPRHAPSADLGGDRKSTRLNSSHTVISYAVFCLKKKKKKK